MGSAILDEQELIEKIRSLPPEKAAEVADFVDFLRERQRDLKLTGAATQLSQAAFDRVWDNPDDALYDEL
jgi:hypothetical protein